MATEATTGVKWKPWGGDDIVYYGDGFTVRALAKLANWWVYTADGTRICDNYAPDFATAKRDAERWIMEREGRLSATATDGSGWIACSERMPEAEERVQIIREGEYTGKGLWAFFGPVTYWRPRPVDQHEATACLFDVVFMSPEKALAAARHVAGCAECRAKLEAKGGA